MNKELLETVITGVFTFQDVNTTTVFLNSNTICSLYKASNDYVLHLVYNDNQKEVIHFRSAKSMNEEYDRLLQVCKLREIIKFKRQN